MQVFNTRTQQLEDVTWSTDKNNEVLATFEDGTFVKFPAGTTMTDLKALVKQHKVANEGQEIISPEQEAEMLKQREQSEKLVEKLNGNAMPTEDKTHAPTDDPDN
jgi:DICT domain-containing protein